MGVVEEIFGGSPIEIVRDAFLTTPTQFVPMRLFSAPISSSLSIKTYPLETMKVSQFNSPAEGVPPSRQIQVSPEEESTIDIQVIRRSDSEPPYKIEYAQNIPYFVDDTGATFLLASDEPILLFEFGRNPREANIRGPRKLNTKIITEAAIFFQFWGNDTYEISISGNFGAMLPQNFFLQPQSTTAYKAFELLRSKFEDDHKYTDSVVGYLVSLQFEEDIYTGILQEFRFTLHQDRPYQIEYSLTMEALARDTDDKDLSSGLSRRTKIANPNRLPDTTQQLNAVEYEFPLNLP